MKNYPALIRTLICLMGTALVLLSCDDSNPIADQPQVVRKKIAAPADRAQPTPVVAAAQPRPAAPAAEPQPPVAQVKPPAPPVPAPAPAQPPKPAAPPAAAGEPPPAPPAVVVPAVLTVEEAKKGTGPMAAVLNIQATEPYNPKGKVDPFEPLFREESAAKSALLKPKKRVSETPLENIDIGQLKLVAIVNARGGNYAMVEESSGKGYVIKPGTYIGRNSGKVLKIEPDKVLIEEEYEDLNGKTVTQNKEMALPKPPGEL